jgi:hypothetical protein
MADVKDITATGRQKWEKQFFSVLNSKEPGSGIANNANPVSYEANEGFIVITNKESRSGQGTANKNAFVLPDYVKFTLAVSGTAGEGFKIVWVEDTIDRWVSGGSSLTSLAACHFIDSFSGFERVSTSAQIHTGDLTLADANSEAAVGISNFRPTVGATIGQIGDEYITKFGGDQQSHGGVSVGSQRIVDIQSPVVLAAGTCLVGHVLIEGQSAASSFDVEAGWTEVRKDLNAG